MSARVLLVVDDNPDDVAILELAAAELPDGFTIEVHESSAAALRRVAAGHQPPSAVLLDWNLPGATASEVLTSIRSTSSWDGVPVVVYSGDSDPVIIHEARSSGASNYVVKPASYDGVVDLLRRLSEITAVGEAEPASYLDLS